MPSQAPRSLDGQRQRCRLAGQRPGRLVRRPRRDLKCAHPRRRRPHRLKGLPDEPPLTDRTWSIFALARTEMVPPRNARLGPSPTAIRCAKRDFREKLMRFLAGTDIQAQVRRLASGSGEVMAAVAYWGKGAAKQTGLAEHKNPKAVRVICDLLSGACNPDEIKTLAHLGFSVSTLDRLHAKVWIVVKHALLTPRNPARSMSYRADRHRTRAPINSPWRRAQRGIWPTG